MMVVYWSFKALKPADHWSHPLPSNFRDFSIAATFLEIWATSCIGISLLDVSSPNASLFAHQGYPLHNALLSAPYLFRSGFIQPFCFRLTITCSSHALMSAVPAVLFYYAQRSVTWDHLSIPRLWPRYQQGCYPSKRAALETDRAHLQRISVYSYALIEMMFTMRELVPQGPDFECL